MAKTLQKLSEFNDFTIKPKSTLSGKYELICEL